VNNGKLIIGKIPYANLFPIFHHLEKNGNRTKYRFVKGVPSKLNKMLRTGELDISPSSSIEYLKHKDQYRILPYLSISSSGPIKSILLFSNYPIEKLDGKTIAVSSDSETSTALLKIILQEFLSLTCTYETTDQSSVKDSLSSYAAVLHIGDTAMREAKKSSNGNAKFLPSLHVYDLGELWHRHTGLPFVFALWVIRKESITEKNNLVQELSEELMTAKNLALHSYDALATKAPRNKWISEEDLVRYWKIISYDFTAKHMEGLRLFEKYLSRI
jgi:chorismate dehydratase